MGGLGGRERVYFNYAYTAAWTVALALFVVLTAVTPWAILFAVLASFRFLEIAVWYMKLLFDPTHVRILTPERNLFFLVLDGAAAVTTIGLWLAAAEAVPGSESAWSAALSTFTLNGAPEGLDGWRADVATGLGTFGGLVLIGAGLGLLVGDVGKRFTHGEPGEYTGPVYPPKPPGKPWNRV